MNLDLLGQDLAILNLLDDFQVQSLFPLPLFLHRRNKFDFRISVLKLSKAFFYVAGMNDPSIWLIIVRVEKSNLIAWHNSYFVTLTPTLLTLILFKSAKCSVLRMPLAYSTKQ
jgi:hypothetical protein